MAHNHNIADTDLHFSIDPITRVIKDESAVKKSLVQFDHNSERVAFDLPRKIENHDMTECNRVEIHYINISSNDSYEGVYEVTDLKASEDENTATFTWLISQNATRIAGSLNFLIRFACVENGVVKYLWNTKIFKGIAVSDGMDNGDVVVEQYADILNEWQNRLNERYIVSLEQTQKSEEDGGTNIWTATFANGATSNFEVKNGSKGEGGTGGANIKTKTVTLYADQWEGSEAEGVVANLIILEGMTADTTVICSVSPNLEMEQEASRCMVRCVEQGANYIAFAALNFEVPTIDIDMNILEVGV
jgi:hypothetical protein